jgi:hypothetical protein
MPSVNINIIRVGIENFTAGDHTTVDNAIATMRSIYATVDMDVPVVEFWDIPLASANGRDIIDDNGEAEALTGEWTVPNRSIDVFVVKLYVGTVAGLSPAPGPCGKNGKGMTGAVVELVDSTTGHGLAHEVGHYLGLAHKDSDSTNLMFPTIPNGGLLTAGQGDAMRQHCFVTPPYTGGSMIIGQDLL